MGLRSTASHLAIAAGCSVLTVGGCTGEERDIGLFGTGVDTGSAASMTGAEGDADGLTQSSTAGGTGASSESGGFKYDVGDGQSTEGPVDCGCGNTEWSYIFIANSGQSTVSKVDTRTLVEEGRYLTREDKAGNPSRTSVSLSGRAVAVANRRGGVTMVWARPELCDPMRNGLPGLQTSSGSEDVLPWGEDDCVEWYTPYHYGTQRPIAWTAGAINPQTCEYEDEAVWIAGCDPGPPTAHLLDGMTGEEIAAVPLTGFPCTFLGPYGGAVDSEGNFWVSNFGQDNDSKLARVDADTHAVEVWTAPIPAYGITVDRKGRPWLSANGGEAFLPNPAGAWAARFDPTIQKWDLAGTGGLGQSGIQEDAKGRMWINTWENPPQLLPIDAESLAIGAPIVLPSTGKGISVDVDGHVWSVLGTTAMRVEPDLGTIDAYDGLVGAYTYSDMTGWALQNAWCNPAG